MEKAAALRPERNPQIVVTLGRGRTGKTVFLSWLAETAARDIPLRIIDADLNNPVLSKRFPDAVKSKGVDDERRIWLEAQFIQQMEAASTPGRFDVLLDLGGGDILMKRWEAELALADMLAGSSIEPIAVHMLGTDLADLSFLEDVEKRKLFCPPKTILILNRGLINPSRAAAEAFGEVMESDVVKHVLGRGGRIAVMPHLLCMEDVEKHGLRFAEAQDVTSPIRNPFNRVRVRRWLTVEMEEMRAGLGGWI